MPSKIYGIVAAGVPFVAMMEQSAEVARLALEHRIGFVSPPDDDGALAQTILDALGSREELKQMGQRARALAQERFDRKIATRRFAEMLADVARMSNHGHPDASPQPARILS